MILLRKTEPSIQLPEKDKRIVFKPIGGVIAAGKYDGSYFIADSYNLKTGKYKVDEIEYWLKELPTN